MQVFLTGGTGYIGSAVLRTLVSRGHGVTALVRSEASAAQVREAGATPLLGDLTDTDWLTDQVRAADAAVHAASPGDETTVAVDTSVAQAVTTAFAGTGKAYVHTGGIWSYGTNPAITEDSPLDPPELTAWRPGVEKIVLAGDGLRGQVVAPAVVYGHGAGLPTLLAGPEVDLIGDGAQHWTTVHVDDLAELYLLALDHGRAGATYIGASGQNPTVRDMAEAAARSAEPRAEIRPQSVEETRARFGAPLAEALLLDQQATGAAARAELGWAPSRPALLADLEHGSYARR